MTENEWFACENPERLIQFLRDNRRANRTKAGRRRMRLFACACCRTIWDMLDSHARHAVTATEAFADDIIEKTEHNNAGIRAGLAAAHKWQIAWDTANLDAQHQATILWRAARAAELAADPQVVITSVAGSIIARDISPRGESHEHHVQIAFVRDIFGNPFREIAFSQDWRSTDAVAIARTMYDSRDFGAMPILADALQDAGCDNEDILTHCRDTTRTHVRGCWVVDLVLGKE